MHNFDKFARKVNNINMKKLFSILIICVLTLVSLKSNVSAQIEHERIINFDSTIEIQEDGSMIVTEKIKVYAMGNEIRRGIYRDFPTLYKLPLGFSSTTGFDILSIKRNGTDEPYHTENENNGVRVFIGVEDYFIPNGVHEYEIKYRTNRQLGYFENYDELFYNITGNGWVFNIESATAKIILPGKFNKDQLDIKGYTGPDGSLDTNYSSNINNDGAKTIINFKTTKLLGSYEGLSIVVDWPKGSVSVPTALDKALYFVTDNLGILVGSLCSFLLLIFIFVTWFLNGRDPKKKTIVPQFAPPDLNPGEARYLNSMVIDDKSLVSTLTSLASKGYIRITEKQGEFSIKKLKESDASLTSEEELLFKKLLGARETLKFSVSNATTLQSAITEYKSFIVSKFSDAVNLNQKFFILIILLSILCICIVNSQSIMRGGEAIGILIGVFIVSIFGFIFIDSFKKSFNKIASGNTGCASIISLLSNGCLSLLFIFIGIIIIIVLMNSASIVGGLMMISLIISVYLYRHAIKVRTVKGRELTDKIEGFAMYMRAAENERIKILNKDIPHDIKTYEKYLPYAIALDLELEWTKQFEEAIEKEKALHNGEYHPTWYVGSISNFNSSSFSSSLSSSISSSSTPPGSSGSGGSGGGGGGGGGGGW